jgi:hypothetical protein
VSKTSALVGQDGVVVELVDFEDGSGLLHVIGLESTLKDKVYRVKVVNNQEGDLLYVLPWRGRDWATVIRSGDPAVFGTYWVLRAPSSDLAVPLAYSKSDGEKVNAAALLAAHEKQKQSGELDALQKYDRRAESTREEQSLAESAASVDADCGSKLKVGVVWDTVEDKALQERSISDYCDSVLAALHAACATPAGKQFVQQQVRQVTCRFDGKGEMSLNAGQLSWAINFELSDLVTLANRAFASLPTSGTQAAN